MRLTPELEAKIDEAITHYPVSKRSAVLTLLHHIQHQEGYLDDEAVNYVASKLDLQPVQVLEVVTFYPGFRRTEPGKFHIRVCRTLSCAMAGSHDLMDSICKEAKIDRSHVDHHHPIAKSEDGVFSVEYAECLACCGFGPVCMVNDDFHEKVAPTDAASLLAGYRAQG